MARLKDTEVNGNLTVIGSVEAETPLSIESGGTGENEKRIAVTIDGLPSGSTYTCYYYPYLGMCFLRLYLTGATYPAMTANTIGTVEDGYRPNSAHALSVAVLQDSNNYHHARVASNGSIIYVSAVAKDATTDDTYIAGFWFV